MKKRNTIILFLFLAKFCCSQISQEEHIDRLVPVCKLWGYFKYHHTNITRPNPNVNWDSILITSLSGFKSAPTYNAFQDSLQKMVDKSGPLDYFIDYWIYRGDSLKINKDLSWQNNPVYKAQTKKLFDSIKKNYKNEAGFYTGSSKGYPYFISDDRFSKIDTFPNENLRIHALFRYWNIINYFYQYHSTNPISWDSCLKVQLKLILNSDTMEEYHLNFKKITKMIHDSKGEMSSPIYDSIIGKFYLPFMVRYIEGKTIIVQKIDSKTIGIDIGDEIIEYNDQPIDSFRAYWMAYCEGSNPAAIDHNVNKMIHKGGTEKFSFKIRKPDNQEYTFQGKRESTNFDSFSQFYYSEKPWRDTILDKGCKFGIISVNKYNSYFDIIKMWEELWDTEAIIIDLRGNTNLSFGDTLLTQHIYNKYTNYYFNIVPNISIPGEFYSTQRYSIIKKKPLYEGRIILLVDERTKKNSETFALSFQSKENVLRIGSQTEGSGGEIGLASLPGKITTSFTINGAYDSSYVSYYKRGVPIDVQILPTIKGIREGKDELLNYALNCSFGIEKKPVSFVIDQSKGLSIFPNPVVSTLHIKSDSKKQKDVKIFDFSQRLIYHSMMSNDIDIDFSSYSNGLYFVKVEDNIVKIVK